MSWSDEKELSSGANAIGWNYYITFNKLLYNIVVLYTNLYLEYYFKFLFIFFPLPLQFPSSTTITPRKNSGPTYWDQVKNSRLFMFWILVFKKKKKSMKKITHVSFRSIKNLIKEWKKIQRPSLYAFTKKIKLLWVYEIRIGHQVETILAQQE